MSSAAVPQIMLKQAQAAPCSGCSCRCGVCSPDITPKVLGATHGRSEAHRGPCEAYNLLCHSTGRLYLLVAICKAQGLWKAPHPDNTKGSLAVQEPTHHTHGIQHQLQKAKSNTARLLSKRRAVALLCWGLTTATHCRPCCPQEGMASVTGMSRCSGRDRS